MVLVPKGHHPCGAPYGYEMYYLNVMAGPLRAVAVRQRSGSRLDLPARQSRCLIGPARARRGAWTILPISLTACRIPR